MRPALRRARALMKRLNLFQERSSKIFRKRKLRIKKRNLTKKSRRGYHLREIKRKNAANNLEIYVFLSN